MEPILLLPSFSYNGVKKLFLNTVGLGRITVEVLVKQLLCDLACATRLKRGGKEEGIGERRNPSSMVQFFPLLFAFLYLQCRLSVILKVGVA